MSKTEMERETESETGTVYLVGAGPGDPDLLTVKAHRLISDADVVLHDTLVGDGVLDCASESAEVVDVGKRSSDRTQDDINRMMVEKSRDGEVVVRLKGGDPNVFGRGGEETEFLASEGVEFEAVPGVTSPLAAGSVSGIPLTHREHASSFTVVTGHEDPTKDESALDWNALARTVEAGGTLVILMGVGRLPDNVERLREAGVDVSSRVALVERASLEGQKVVSGTLDDIVEKTERAGVEPPAVTIVGDVVGVRDCLTE